MALILVTTFAVTVAIMALIWLVSLALRDVSIVDIYWGPGFVVIAWIAVAMGQSGLPAFLLAGLITIWGLRLGSHLFMRSRGKGEDPRYAAMRAARGDAFRWQSLYIVFGLQSVLMWLISWPVLFVAGGPTDHLGPVAALGATIAVAGLVIEALADFQLRQFKRQASNDGLVMDRGLWRYSRHPNYFGDAVFWWGIYIAALDAPGTWWTIVSPLVMTALLLRVSGVPMLERGLSASKPGYADYAARTSAFIPLPPRSGSG